MVLSVPPGQAGQEKAQRAAFSCPAAADTATAETTGTTEDVKQ